MHIITKDELEHNKEKYFLRIRNGSVFIYPTDTIYGIGCSALNSESVKKIRNIKERPHMPFSVIAPSKKWILENCIVEGEAKEWVDKLPGPYTLILKLKNPSAISKEVNPNNRSIGVRIPRHWIYAYVAELGIPIVTTSANKAGKNFMTSIDNLDPGVKIKTEFILYEGEKIGQPSTLVHLENEEVEVIER